MEKIYNILDVEKCIAKKNAIIFDIDDTLYSEKDYVRSGYKKVAELLPMIENAEEQLWQLFENKKNAIDEILVTHGVYSDDLKQKCLQAYRFQVPDIHLYDGVRDMLKRIKKRGCYIGIITDGRPEGQWAKIKALDLECLVDKIIITDELGGIEYRKPNPASFKKMKENLQVEYASMIYIGDNMKKDFSACHDLGIEFIHFANKDGLYQ